MRYFFTQILLPAMKRTATLLLASLFLVSFASLSAQNFRVQIAAYGEAVPDTFFRAKDIQNVIASRDQMGMHRYFVGACETREEAEKILEDVTGKGFPNAFIVDLEEQRVLGGVHCPYFRNGVAFKKDPQREETMRVIYFEFGQHSLSPEAKEELDFVFQKLKANLTLKLNILAYTDAVGDADANVELASSRARSARNYLINKGIRADRMFMKVFGEADPFAPNSEEINVGKKEDLPENRKLNRRVVLSLTDENGAAQTGDTIGGRK